MQLFDGVKYLSAIKAVCMSTTYDLKKGLVWILLAGGSSGVATIIGTYWDLVVDWRLLRQNSRDPWLRDELFMRNKFVYVGAMVLNVVLRLAWLQTVLGFREARFLHRTDLVTIIAGLEIVQRGILNFFRLENEHLNNVGKHWAFKSVPLLFCYDDIEEKDG